MHARTYDVPPFGLASCSIPPPTPTPHPTTTKIQINAELVKLAAEVGVDAGALNARLAIAKGGNSGTTTTQAGASQFRRVRLGDVVLASFMLSYPLTHTHVATDTGSQICHKVPPRPERARHADRLHQRVSRICAQRIPHCLLAGLERPIPLLPTHSYKQKAGGGGGVVVVDGAAVARVPGWAARGVIRE